MTSPLGYTTQPLKIGAPLPPEAELVGVDPVDREHEIARCEIELMYAIARHRKSWANLRTVAEARDEKAGKVGMLSTLESDPHWKKATGDVKWWAAEMTAQATALVALKGMRQPTRQGSAEYATKPLNVRQLVHSWDPSTGTPPSKAQYDAALIWRKMAPDRMGSVDEAQTLGVIGAYNRAYADVTGLDGVEAVLPRG